MTHRPIHNVTPKRLLAEALVIGIMSVATGCATHPESQLQAWIEHEQLPRLLGPCFETMANERAERARNWSLHHECSSISHVGM